VAEPRTWLLQIGWRQRGGGPIERDEAAAAAVGAVRAPSRAGRPVVATGHAARRAPPAS
jgi:hypothetical protein